MKTKHVVVMLAGVVILVGAFWHALWPVSTSVQVTTTTLAPSLSPVERRGQATASANGMNAALSNARETAAQINLFLEAVPTNRPETRDHLRGMQALFFISDYIMAAKTNDQLALSKSAIVNAFSQVNPDTSAVEQRLTQYAVRSYPLTDHYRYISEVAGATNGIREIKAAIAMNGYAINTESQLLMDCIRYAVHTTGIEEMYGDNPADPAAATSLPEALNSLHEHGDGVFVFRLKQDGLDTKAALNVMAAIKSVRLHGLSPADVEIPAPRELVP